MDVVNVQTALYLCQFSQRCYHTVLWAAEEVEEEEEEEKQKEEEEGKKNKSKKPNNLN